MSEKISKAIENLNLLKDGTEAKGQSQVMESEKIKDMNDLKNSVKNMANE